MAIEVSGALFQGDPSIQPEIGRAIAAAQSYALNQLRRRTPVDTGALQASWKVEPAPQGLKIINPQPYAGFVERSQPMLAPTLPTVENYFERELAEALSQKFATPVRVESGGSSSNPPNPTARPPRPKPKSSLPAPKRRRRR